MQNLPNSQPVTFLGKGLLARQSIFFYMHNGTISDLLHVKRRFGEASGERWMGLSEVYPSTPAGKLEALMQRSCARVNVKNLGDTTCFDWLWLMHFAVGHLEAGGKNGLSLDVLWIVWGNAKVISGIWRCWSFREVQSEHITSPSHVISLVFRFLRMEVIPLNLNSYDITSPLLYTYNPTRKVGFWPLPSNLATSRHKSRSVMD